jgi:hypothetical protein
VGMGLVGKAFAKWPLQQRIIALAAAYAIALAGLIASFAAAQAAAEAINQLDGVLCHSSAAVGQPAPPADESNSKICVESCCIGCLAMAAAVPPRVLAAAVPHSLSQRFAPLKRFILIGSVDFNAHRSRGPPPAS